MSYENQPSTGSSTTTTRRPGKDNRAVIYTVLVVALLGTWGYIIYDHSKSKQEITQLQTQVTNVDSARTVVQDEYNEALSRMDSLTGSNAKLTGNLAERQAEIEKLKKDIKGIITSKNGDMSAARSKIALLNTKINDLVAEVDRLRGENKELTASNHQLSAERDTLTVKKTELEQNLATTKTEKANIEDVGSTLHASNINITAIDLRSNGKEKTTTTAKRADALRVSFDIDENRIAPSGTKELFITITDPSGNTVAIPAYGSGNFVTREEGQKVYTNKVLVPYEQGKRTPVQFDWKQDSRFQTGEYKIAIYQNGYKIGEGTKVLKKGGLFS